MFEPEAYGSISRIARELHFVLNIGANAEIGIEG